MCEADKRVVKMAAATFCVASVKNACSYTFQCDPIATLSRLQEGKSLSGAATSAMVIGRRMQHWLKSDKEGKGRERNKKLRKN
jgi:hypothetical protein